MAHDSDLFNRWQAANDYATRTLIHLVARRAKRQALGQGARPTPTRSAPSSPTTSSSRPIVAELLRLPTEADIAREIAPQRRSRPRSMRRGASSCGWSAPRSATTSSGSISATPTRARSRPTPPSAGRRALRNAALDAARRARHAGRPQAAARALSPRHQHDRRGARAVSDRRPAGCPSATRRWPASTSAGRTTTSSSTPGSPRRRSSPRSAHARPRQGADAASAVRADRAQQGARADRQLRRWPIPSQFNRARRRGLSVPRRAGAGDREVQPADRRPPARRLPQLARARAGAPASSPARSLQGIAKTEGLSRDVYEIASKMIE